MAAFKALCGDKILTKDGEVDTEIALGGKKAVAFYFSAHWCPPCRGFTPKLAEWYTKSYKAKGLEVVFVSSDRDEEAFDEYYAEQPWLSLPYAARDIKAKLSKKFKVNGIPSLVIFGPDGETITTDGRAAVSDDPTGERLPWKPPTFWEALGDTFLQGSEGETVDVDDIKGEGKYIGLYFSAHWCPPCRSFTPALAKAYKESLKAKSLEIIFVSSDKSQAEFKEYYDTMPWLAIPNGDKRKGLLSSRFGVSGIPTLVIVDGATGETINTNGTGKVRSDPTGAEFPWVPKALVDMTEDGPDGINETTSLCVMMEGCDAACVSAAVAALEPVAEAAKKAKEDLLIFYAPKAEGPTEQIRKLTKLGEPSAKPQMVLLDIPDEGGYYVSPATEVTAETVSGFLEAYKAKALERQQLG
jgi:nucleoredoxin